MNISIPHTPHIHWSRLFNASRMDLGSPLNSFHLLTHSSPHHAFRRLGGRSQRQKRHFLFRIASFRPSNAPGGASYLGILFTHYLLWYNTSMNGNQKLAEAVLLDHQPISKDGWSPVRTSWLDKVKEIALETYRAPDRQYPTNADIDDAYRWVMGAMGLSTSAAPPVDEKTLRNVIEALLKMPRHSTT